jgi:flagellar motor switch protein FliN
MALQLGVMFAHEYGHRVTCHVASVDQLTYNEFQRSVPNPTLLFRGEMRPIKNFLVELDPKLTVALLKEPELTRENLDKLPLSAGADKLARDVLKEFRKPWATLLPWTIKAEAVKTGEIENNPQFVDLVDQSEMVILITMEVILDRIENFTEEGPDEVEGLLNIVYPITAFDKKTYEALEGQPSRPDGFKYLTNRKVPQGGPLKMPDNDSETKTELPRNLLRLSDIDVEVDVRLGKTKQKLSQLLTLGEGSIIELDKLAGEAVDIYVSGKHFAQGEVVVIDESFGVRVTELLE